MWAQLRRRSYRFDPISDPIPDLVVRLVVHVNYILSVSLRWEAGSLFKCLDFMNVVVVQSLWQS